MEKLKELNRIRRVLLSECRQLQIKTSRNLLSQSDQRELQAANRRYDQVCSEIKVEEQNVIRNKFGDDILSEWNMLKQMEAKPYTKSSQKGQHIEELKIKLQEVSELMESVNRI